MPLDHLTADQDAPAEARPKRKRRSTGPYKAADGRREAILDAAIEHFAKWGYFNSSIPKIAGDVGITKTGLLHHFSNKEVLLTAVLELRDERALENFFQGQLVVEPLEFFAHLAEQAKFNETQPGLTQMFSTLAAESSNPDNPAHAYFTRRYKRIIRGFSDMLDRAVADGTVKPDTDVDQVASEMLAMLDGFAIQWAFEPDTFSLHDHVFSYLDRLARSITPDARGLTA